MRTFISIKLPPKILEYIKEIQDGLPAFEGKKTELKNLHLTLKFLGEINSEELEKVKLEIRKIKFNKFESEIKSIGFFDNPKQGIVWLEMTNCKELHAEIDKCLESLFKREVRFMCHLTIARVKKIQDKKGFIHSLKNIKIIKRFFIVDKFYLIESFLKKEGADYKVIEEYNLK